ncbi:hypothetical protein HAX54_019953, partial [Datura stramonium]|nr:hypothetical protein [Datura stramonium]
QLEHTARREAPSSWLYWPRDAIGNLAQGQAQGTAVLAQGHTLGSNTPAATARATRHLSWRDEARAAPHAMGCATRHGGHSNKAGDAARLPKWAKLTSHFN